MSQNTHNVGHLELDLLYPRVRALTPDYAAYIKENCIICLNKNGHGTNVLLGVKSNLGERDTLREDTFVIVWTGEVTEEMIRAYGDITRATDQGACGIALLLVSEMTPFVAVEQSSIGTTIDYYLAPMSQNDTLIFNHSARLEVSGILTENSKNTVDGRVDEKLRRLKSEDDLSDYIIVVELGVSRNWCKWGAFAFGGKRLSRCPKLVERTFQDSRA